MPHRHHRYGAITAVDHGLGAVRLERPAQRLTESRRAGQADAGAPILDHTRAGLPVELGDDCLSVLTEQQARQEAGWCFSLVGSLTALGASDSVTTAELFAAERRLRGFVPEHQSPALSPTQNAALRAVARGDVAITGGKPYLRREDIRVSISTIRALESRGLVMREDCPDWFRDERVHLTASGRRGLAASFARPRSTAPAATRPPARPAATAARAAAR
ncbi:hypothetical protein [Streptomyces lydicus]|uniref:hypothetical protein n=1 Tax=Streptomyces lydicus TaxID=47763 RepID=UPI0037B6DF80